MIHVVRKSTPGFTKSLRLVLIGLVLTEIQAFKNVKKYKEMYGNADKSGHLKGHNQLAHMRIRYHFIANLHINNGDGINVLNRYKNNIMG